MPNTQPMAHAVPAPIKDALLESAEQESSFQNHYLCTKCDCSWIDHWSCSCNDRCPQCNSEIEPHESIELS